MIRQIVPALFKGLAAGVREAHAAAPAPDPARLCPKLQALRRALPQAVQGGLQAGRTSVDRQQTPCAHDALHLFRSGAGFSTGMPLVAHLALISPFRFTLRHPRPAGSLYPSD